MRVNRTSASPITYLMLAAMVLLVQACGEQVAEDKGCPSGTFLASAGDTISTPANVTVEYEYPSGSGTVFFTPLTFVVTDASGPRNNICLLVYTADTMSGLGGPFWYADDTYATYIIGSGPANGRAIVTDDTGVATVYWSSAILPPSNPRVVSGGTPTAPTYTAGTDQSGTSHIDLYSGAQAAQWNFNWTVKGQPAQ